jgi:acetyl esterase/lipase
VSRVRLLLDLVAPRRTFRYGSEHRCQKADLYLPAGAGPHPVVVTIHGGSWMTRYGKIVMCGVAGDLRRRGFAVWNIEYRRIGRGQGGGWPATFADVGAAIDRLADLNAPLDLAGVTYVGHSAGGQLALWAAGRGRLPAGAPGAATRIEPVAAVSMAGVNDLAQSYAETPGGAVGMLMGGGPDRWPERYALADPIAAVPLAIPVLLVHGTDDQTVSVRRSRNYAEASRARGGEVELVEIAGAAGAHSRHVDPDGESWRLVARWLAERQRERRAVRGGADPAAQRG